METEPSTSPAAWLEDALGASTPVRGTCLLGRSASNQVVLADEKVSRRHAMINAQGRGEFWLVDLGSRNGTYLNRRRIGQPTRLSDGDRIEVGSAAFTFRVQQEAPTTSTEQTTERTIQNIRSQSCWLLVADLEDSTQLLKSLPPDEVPRVTGRWLASCKELIEAQHGAINKFLGDGFLAYWPALEDMSAAVLRAVQALTELRAAGNTPRFRVVVHYGKIFLGGGGSLGEESLVGSEVNFVFRMEKLAAQLGVATLLSEAAEQRLRPALPTTDVGRHPLPSFDGEFRFFSAN